MITELSTNVLAALLANIAGDSPIIVLIACLIQIHFLKAICRFQQAEGLLPLPKPE